MENCTIAVFHLPVADNRSGPRGEGGTRRDAEEPEGDGKLCYEPAEYGYWFEFCVLDGRIIKLRRPKDEVRQFNLDIVVQRQNLSLDGFLQPHRHPACQAKKVVASQQITEDGVIVVMQKQPPLMLLLVGIYGSSRNPPQAGHGSIAALFLVAKRKDMVELQIRKSRRLL
jgi:hypothetical protein